MKKLGVLAVFVAACLLLGALTTQAQLRTLETPDRPWNERIVIGLPQDDDGDDEGDDEGSDCSPYPVAVAQTGQTGCWDETGSSVPVCRDGPGRRVPLWCFGGSTLHRER